MNGSRAFDLSGDGDAQMFTSVAAGSGLLRARGQVRSRGCSVAVTYSEKELFPVRQSDSVSIRPNSFYKNRKLGGPCGNFDGRRNNDKGVALRDADPRAFSFKLGESTDNYHYFIQIQYLKLFICVCDLPIQESMNSCDNHSVFITVTSDNAGTPSFLTFPVITSPPSPSY